MSMTGAIIATAAAFLLFWGGLNAFMGWISGATVKQTVLISLAQLVVIAFVLAATFGLSTMWAGVS